MMIWRIVRLTTWLIILPASQLLIAQPVQIGGLKKPVRLFKNVDLSPSGKLVAASGWYFSDISIFETFTGKEIQRLQGSNDSRGIYFLRDNIIIRINPYGVDLVRIEDDTIIASLPVKQLISGHSFSLDSKTLAISTREAILVFDCENDFLRTKWEIPVEAAENLAISPDGNYISARVKNNIQCWNITNQSIAGTVEATDVMAFGLGNEAVITLMKTPLAYRLYSLDGIPGGPAKKIPLISSPFSTEIYPYGNGFTFTTYNQTIITYASGYQEVIKTGLDYHKARAHKQTGLILTWNSEKIEITDDEGSLFTRILAQQLNSFSMLPDRDGETFHFIVDSSISIAGGNKIIKKIPLGSKVVSSSAIADDWQVVSLENKNMIVYNPAEQKVIAQFSFTSLPAHFTKAAGSQAIWWTDFLGNTLYQFQPGTGAVKKIFTQEKSITAIASPSPEVLYLGDESGAVKELVLLNDDRTKISQSINQFTDPVSFIKPLKKGLLAASYGRFSFVPAVFSDQENQLLFVGHQGYISSLETNSAEQYIYSTSEDHSIRLWDRRDGRCIITYKLDSGTANRIILPDDGKFLFTGNDLVIGAVDDSLVIRNWNSLQQKMVVQAPNNNSPLKLAINKQGTLLAAVDRNTVKVRDIQSGFLISEFTTDNKFVNGISFSADGSTLAVAAGNTIQCFDPVNGTMVSKMDMGKTGRLGNYGDGTPALFSRSFHDVEAFNNAFVGINVNGWHDPLVVHKNSGRKIFEFFFNPGAEFDNLIIDFKCTPDGQWLATMGSKFIKIFYNKDSLEVKYIFPRSDPGKTIRNYSDYMNFSPDGKYFLWVEVDKTKKIRIVDLSTGSIIKEHAGGIGVLGKNGQYFFASSDETVSRGHVLTRETELLDYKWDMYINNLVYNDAKNIFAVSDILGNIKVIDGRSGKSIKEMNRWDQYTYDARLSPDKNTMLLNNRWGLYTVDMNTLKREKLPGNNYPFSGVFSPDGQTCYFRSGSFILSKNISTNQPDTVIQHELLENAFQGMRISSDGAHLIILGESNDVLLADIKEKTIWFSFNRFSFRKGSGLIVRDVVRHKEKLYLKGVYINTYSDSSGLTHALISADGNFITEPLAPEVVLQRKGESGFTEKIFEADARVFEMSPSGKYLAFMKDLEMYILDHGKKDTVFSRDNSFIGNIVKAVFDDQENYFILATDDGYVEVYDLLKRTTRKRYSVTQTGLQLLTRFKANEMGILDIQVKEQLLLVTGSNSFLSLYKINRREEKLVDMVFIRGSDQLFINQEGYYYATKDALPYVAYKRGNRIFSLDLADIKYNRPDRILQSVRSQDTLLVTAYRNAYLKRLKKQKVGMGWEPEYENMPGCRLLNDTEIPYDVSEKKLTLKLAMNTPAGTLESFNIWVNNAPVYGKNGTRIAGREIKNADTVITITLSPGVNQIEYAVRNSSGMESSRTPLFVRHTPDYQVNDKVYFIGIGIDQFADAKFNLQYSAKDIRDLAAKLKEKFKDKIIIDTLINKAVTTAEVKRLKQKLQKTSEHDRVIVSYSGHGMLSRDFDYFLSTYSVNFDKPEENGLPYEELENLLDSIPARRKLLLIDACHSGEVDKEDLVTLNEVSDSLIKGIKPVAYKKQGQLGLKNSFELMQSLFVQVGKGTGAIIISAAAGTQFALEKGDLKNGVFTYSLLEAMQTHPEMTVSGLKTIVSTRVEELTRGLQKPTSRNETMAIDWQVW